MMLGAAALAALPAERSLAADFPVKAVAPVIYNWSGCYAGINAGLGATASDFGSSVDSGTHLLAADPAVVGGSGTGSFNGDNFAGGGQVGCNLQSGALVYGLEGDVDYFHGNSHLTNNTNTLSDGVTPFTINQSTTTNYIATVRPRIGIAADRDLGYLTAGAAFTSVNYTESYIDVPTAGGSIVSPGTGLATASKSLVGWAAGAGWEHAWTDHATFRFEYLYTSFPGTTALGAISDPAGGVNTLHGSSNLVIQIARVGLNYKF
jgi:outer membrane immunogenic protein